MLALVSSNSFANVGDLFVDLSPVACVTIGYRPRLLNAGLGTKHAANALWLAYYTHGLSDGDSKA